MSMEKCPVCGDEYFRNRKRDHWNKKPECKSLILKLREEEYTFACDCSEKFKSKKALTQHKRKIHNWKDDKELNGVECKICGVKRHSLKSHIKTHNVSIQEYESLYGEIQLSEKSKENYSKQNKINCWGGINTTRELLKNKEYRIKHGEKISMAILNSPKARLVRKQNMTKLNKSDEQRSKASAHLKRKWLEEDFTLKSHEWQNDKDKLKAALLKGCLNPNLVRKATFISKCEREIKKWIHELGYKTNTSRFKIDGKNRFYDIRIDKLLIEIDGPWHFLEFFERFENHSYDPNIDESKNRFAVDNGFTLLRVSNWGDKIEDQKLIIKDFLDRIDSLESGVYKYGKKYDSLRN